MTEGCLDTDAFVELLEGQASAERRSAIANHTSRCAECRHMLSALARDGDASEEPETLGRYIVRERLGSGAMGVVYAAFDPELQREVAIKVLAPALGDSAGRAHFHERLRREARALAQLAHPNVVAIHDVGQVGDRLYIVMERLDGETLASWCRGERRRPHEVLAQLVAAGRGLAAAHAAGIVHRDVKLENMMFGADGRVRVVDFGLARSDAPEPSAAGAPGDDPATTPTLTRRGAVMGTPHYMAPEQYRGGAADARSDQFAFCVAVYAALYDAWPFPGDDLGSLGDAVAAGALREPPRRRGVPRRIARALRRGLAVDPAARFASIEDVLAALVPVRRVRVAAIGAVAVAVAAVSVLALRTVGGADGPRPCEDMATRLAGVWDPVQRAHVTGALRATGVPFAEDTARTVVARLDDYAARWSELRTEACTATRIRGDQPEPIMGLRIGCLDDRRRDLAALVAALGAADRASVRRAVAATYQLPELATCSDVAALRGPGKPPRDPAAVASVRDELARARALRAIGRYRDALAVAAALAPRIAATSYRPLEAEAALLEGTLHNDLDAPAPAIAALERAVFAAEASAYDVVATKALVLLVHLRGTRADFTDADRSRARATAALERIGGAPALAADLDYAVGLVAMVRGDLAAAEAALARSVRAAEALHGAADLRLASSLIQLGQVELRRMSDRARPYLERALAIQERLLGPNHPDLGPVHVALGGAAYERGDHDAAAAQYERAIAILEGALGRRNAQVANALGNLALTRQWQGRADDALAAAREAVAIDAEVLPAADPETAAHLVTESQVLEQLERHADALAILDRALAMMHALYGRDHQDIADALHARAVIELALNQLDRALADGRAAVAMFAAVAPDVPLAELHRTVGRIELARHDPAAAAASFEAARARPRPDTDATARAWLDALYGRALVESNRDRAKGLALVRSGYAVLRATPDAERERRDVETWMRAAGIQ